MEVFKRGLLIRGPDLLPLNGDTARRDVQKAHHAGASYSSYSSASAKGGLPHLAAHRGRAVVHLHQGHAVLQLAAEN